VFSHLDGSMLVVSAAAGDVGIAPRHAAFISPIKPDDIASHTEGGEERHIYVSGGIVERSWYVRLIMQLLCSSWLSFCEIECFGSNLGKEGHLLDMDTCFKF